MPAFDRLQTIFGPTWPMRLLARSCPMPTPKERKERQQLRDRHSAEIEASQAELRRSITETERLVGESDKMLRRHREECDKVDAGRSSSITKDEGESGRIFSE